MNDLTLIEDVRGGRPGAWEMLFEHCAQPVFSVLLRYTRNDRSQAQELSQKVILRMLENLDQLQPPYNVPGWACTIAHHIGLDYVRGLRRESDGLKHYLGLIAPLAQSPEEELIRKNQIELLRSVLQSDFDEATRDTGRLFYEDELSVREIAEAKGISETAVTTRLSRFRGRLRKKLLSKALER